MLGCSDVSGSLKSNGLEPWRRAQQPTPVFLPGESQGQRSLAGYSPWGRKESDMTLYAHTECSPPGSSVPGILQARILQCVAISCFRGSPDPGIEPPSLCLLHRQVDSLQLCHLGSRGGH